MKRYGSLHTGTDVSGTVAIGVNPGDTANVQIVELSEVSAYGSKDFMEAGKKRLAGDTARAANRDEVKELRREAKDPKEVVAEQTLELRLLKKACSGMGPTANEVCWI